MSLEKYIQNLNARYSTGITTEHSFRGNLQNLIEDIVPEVQATNEPKRQQFGAPDYILTKREIPVGFIEAKDIGDTDLQGQKKNGNKEQFDRYKASLENLIFTDYLEFYLYRGATLITQISIGRIEGKKIIPIKENFAPFVNLIQDFTTYVSQTIRSPKRLAEMMAGKARLLSDIIERSLTYDVHDDENTTIKEQFDAFKEILIHDITPQDFADVYAQTIAYGMFAARLHDSSMDNFTRQEAAELIPKTNPFLRKLFGYIAGPDIDTRIKWIVDDLAKIFLACDVKAILKNFGKGTKTEDPIIHFYETFLSEYDPKLRKNRGVWYTPAPVVNFIVRAVDDILKKEFLISEGLADTSKTRITIDTQHFDKRKQQYKTGEVDVHRIQILDPATGTGTFLAETIKQIHKKFEGQKGIWSNYVEKHLLPRLNGFELLMASYAMAHLQLNLLLSDTGYKSEKEQRLRVYLTNSLEEYHKDTGTLFASWLSNEANEANYIKRDTPVMVVLGNPPYSVSSSNKGEWIEKLISDYKKNLNERNIQPLSDDYIKFIRYGQHFIDKNGTGVLAYISNNSFIDGIIHRQMRKNLLESFDKIYILDLHGNSKKKETAPDGSVDQNVFGIMQGVSINIFIKTGKKKSGELGKVYHYDLFGKRNFKYDFLSDNHLNKIGFKELLNISPNYFFVNKEFDNADVYNTYFELRKLFLKNSMGIATGDDNNLVAFDKDTINRKFKSAHSFFYRPFDIRFTIFDNKILQRARYDLMSNYKSKNLGLNIVRQSKGKGLETLISNDLTNRDFITNHTYNLPLYLYPDKNKQTSYEEKPTRIPNLNKEIVHKIEKKLGLGFVPECYEEPGEEAGQFCPKDLLDYIYAVLHSPSYREKYKEFLKIDFPRVPYPKNKKIFWQLVEIGRQIREIHLLESQSVNEYITQYPIDGNNLVRKVTYTSGKVYINDTQYFDHVPAIAWNFYIGGYQPAQKWLKDRKGRVLDYEDILHYQKIIVALTETNRLMQAVDKIKFM